MAVPFDSRLLYGYPLTAQWFIRILIVLSVASQDFAEGESDMIFVIAAIGEGSKGRVCQNCVHILKKIQNLKKKKKKKLNFGVWA